MRQQILIGLGLAAWATVAFGAGLFITFPEDALLKRLRYEVQEASGGEMALTASSARPWRLTGVALSDVTLLSVPKAKRGRRAEEPEPPTPMLTSSSVAARVELLSLLRGKQAARFSTDIYDGDLSGRVSISDTGSAIQATADALNLALIPLVGETWSLDAGGRMNLNVDLDLPDKIKESEGTVSLLVDGLTLDIIEVGGIPIGEQATFSRAVLRMEADKGKLEVKEGEFISDLVEIELGGYVTLAKQVKRMRMRLEVKFSLADKFDLLVKNIPQFKRARDDDGVYHFTVSGTPNNPRFSEDRTATRANRAPGAGRQRIEDSIREREEGMSEDELKEERADRLRRMQDRLGGGRRNAPNAIPAERPNRPDARPTELLRPGEDPLDDEPIDDEDFDDDEPIDDEEFNEDGFE